MENIFFVIFDVFNFGLVAFLWWLTIKHYNDLPQRIPIHFNIIGKANRFGDKMYSFFIPVLGLLLYLVFLYITRHPENSNFPVTVTEHNRALQYSMMKIYLRCLLVLVILTFLNTQDYVFRYSPENNIKPRVPIFITVLAIIISVLVMFIISNSLK
ncbi:DUF1648 domain-containing protein [Chryseobacterium sp.]|uniref:DUF1648 domain-containing protein n=1 Tax=Chryseobacterium sp. TaxID=1871047 RepID=UPI0025C37402|nr:DUF1648 domain-containing protein [Chryseobacterium sp.]MBV8328163.1 DUF1648 domain-containing protein [Chryseobacterium sp.]